jgi:hypothetical protein
MNAVTRLLAPTLEKLDRARGAGPGPENFPTFYSEPALDVLRAVAEAMFDEHDTHALDAFERRADAFFASCTGVMLPVAHALPWIFELAPRLTGFGPRRFSRLRVTERRAVLRRMARSESMGLAGALGSAKILLSSLYLEEPGLLESMGLDLGGMHPISLDHVGQTEQMEEAV